MTQSYSSPIRFGKKEVAGIFSQPCYAQEKIDGSQFSFGRTPEGILWCSSRNVLLSMDKPNDARFQKGVDHVLAVQNQIPNGMTFRCELVTSPRHNVLKYDRTPKNFLVLFDIEDFGEYLLPDTHKEFAEALGIEAVDYVPVNFRVDCDYLIEQPSMLGGRREGICVKQIPTRKVGERLCAKLVTEEFKEVKTMAVKGHKTPADVLKEIGESLRTEARWHKAVQHLSDQGKLTGEMKDIGPLFGEISADIKKEEYEAVKDALIKAFWPVVMKTATQGFPDWYAQQLESKKENV